MTNREKTEYSELHRKFMKRIISQEEIVRYKALRRLDQIRLAKEGYGYTPSESYLTSNSYDR